MRDLVVTKNITLDGVIEATEGWFDPAGGKDDVSDVETALRKQREAADALLLGRVTFEQMRGPEAPPAGEGKRIPWGPARPTLAARARRVPDRGKPQAARA